MEEYRLNISQYGQARPRYGGRKALFIRINRKGKERRLTQ